MPHANESSRYLCINYRGQGNQLGCITEDKKKIKKDDESAKKRRNYGNGKEETDPNLYSGDGINTMC